MKKLIPLMMIALSSAAGLHAQDTVTSVNMVGMIKHDLVPNGFKIVTLAFPDNENGATLGSAFGSVANETRIFLWENNGYTLYTYFEGAGWFQGFTNADNIVIPNGSAIWIKDSGSGSQPINLGEVPTVEAFVVSFQEGLNMIANPYPTNLTLGDIDASSLSDGDTIFSWENNTYKRYVYFNGAGWFEGFTNVDDQSIEAGNGFWLKASASGSISFSKPF